MLWIQIRIDFGRLDPDPDPGGQKMTHKKRRKVQKFNVVNAGCSPLKAGGFSCSFYILRGGLGINYRVLNS